MSDLDDFKSDYALADRLLASIAAEQLADYLRILALHIGDYRLRFGQITGQDLLDLLGTTEISDDQARILREGMEVFLGHHLPRNRALFVQDTPGDTFAARVWIMPGRITLRSSDMSTPPLLAEFEAIAVLGSAVWHFIPAPWG
jgi:hypothetical protein